MHFSRNGRRVLSQACKPWVSKVRRRTWGEDSTCCVTPLITGSSASMVQFPASPTHNVSSPSFWKRNAGGGNVATEVFLSGIFDVIAIRGNARRPGFLLAGSLSEGINYQIFFDHSMTLA